MTGDWLYRLQDPRDRTWGRDKLWHLLGAGLLAWAIGWHVAIAGAILVELVQAIRWLELTDWEQDLIERGKLPWPWMCDRASLKDLLADAIGILAGVLLR